MKNYFFNIEKSGPHRGEYVGYANGRVYRIRNTSSKSYSSWTATKQNDVPGEKLSDNYSLSGTTLEILSGKLAALPNPYPVPFDGVMMDIAHGDRNSCPHCGEPNCERNHMAENALKDTQQNKKA